MTDRTARGLLALVVLAYIAVFLRFPPLDIQDCPNHLARALVMEDLIFRNMPSFFRSTRGDAFGASTLGCTWRRSL
jgi:hypothetical protein